MKKEKMQNEETNNPRERLLKTALDLIYRQGFDVTTVNQLIEVSETHKASFYRYFQNKEEVGELYLQMQGDTYIEGWKVLMAKSESPKQFVRIWISMLKRQVKRNVYFGCPIARFMVSSDKSPKSLELGKSIIESYYHLLADFFGSFEPRGNKTLIEAQDENWRKAKQFVKIFQGNSQLYVITQNADYIDEMENEMLSLFS